MSRSFERCRLRTRTHGVNPPERGRRGRRGGRCVLFLSTTRCPKEKYPSSRRREGGDFYTDPENANSKIESPPHPEQQTICAAAGDAADSHPAHALIGYDRLTKGACQNERSLPKGQAAGYLPSPVCRNISMSPASGHT